MSVDSTTATAGSDMDTDDQMETSDYETASQPIKSVALLHRIHKYAPGPGFTGATVGGFSVNNYARADARLPPPRDFVDRMLRQLGRTYDISCTIDPSLAPIWYPADHTYLDEPHRVVTNHMYRTLTGIGVHKPPRGLPNKVPVLLFEEEIEEYFRLRPLTADDGRRDRLETSHVARTRRIYTKTGNRVYSEVGVMAQFDGVGNKNWKYDLPRHLTEVEVRLILADHIMEQYALDVAPHGMEDGQAAEAAANNDNVDADVQLEQLELEQVDAYGEPDDEPDTMFVMIVPFVDSPDRRLFGLQEQAIECCMEPPFWSSCEGA